MARRKKDEENKIRGAVEIGGGLVIGQQALRSGAPRALGVRLESHSTSRKNARKILRDDKGWLDPNKGGTGASVQAGVPHFIDNSKNYVHITGNNKDHFKKILERETDIPKNIGAMTIPSRAMQRALYRTYSTGEPTAGNALQAALGIRGKTMYVGGSDDYFDKNFIADVDDIALKTNKPLKVYGSRLAATVATIKKDGPLNLMKANKSRVGVGLAALGGGGYVAQKLIRSGVKRMKPEQRRKIGIGVKKAHKKGKFK